MKQFSSNTSVHCNLKVIWPNDIPFHFSEFSPIWANGVIIYLVVQAKSESFLILLCLSCNSRQFISKFCFTFEVNINPTTSHLHCKYASLSHTIFTNIVESCDNLQTSSLDFQYPYHSPKPLYHLLLPTLTSILHFPDTLTTWAFSNYMNMPRSRLYICHCPLPGPSFQSVQISAQISPQRSFPHQST